MQYQPYSQAQFSFVIDSLSFDAFSLKKFATRDFAIAKNYRIYIEALSKRELLQQDLYNKSAAVISANNFFHGVIIEWQRYEYVAGEFFYKIVYAFPTM